MLIKAGICLLGLLVQVLASPERYVQPGFVEDVIKKFEAAYTGDTRIVSGWEAYPGQHPHQAALRMVDSTGGVGGCGGSVIAREWVVTAAHCTGLRVTIVVRLGLVNMTSPQYIMESTKYFNHPTFDDLNSGAVQPNDIALVKLPIPVTYSELLKPIKVQPSADAFRNYNGLKLYASGHGRLWTLGASPENLNWVYLTGISNALCVATFGGAVVTANTICARYYNVTSQSTCQGDSGGPLVHEDDNGTPILVGVTSFVAGGNFGCHSGIPAGFIRPGPFHSWFTEVSGIDFENLDEEDVTEAPTTTTTSTTTTTTTTTQAPTTTTQAPTTTTQAPTTTTQAPTTTTQAPSTTTEAPTTTTQAPSTTTQAPITTTQGPSSTTQAPITTTQGPTTTTVQPPTTTARPPSTTTARPPSTTQPPTTQPIDPEEESDEDADCEDPELCELLKRLEVKVKVLVRMNKYKWKKKTEKQIP